MPFLANGHEAETAVQPALRALSVQVIFRLAASGINYGRHKLKVTLRLGDNILNQFKSEIPLYTSSLYNTSNRAISISLLSTF